MRLTVTVLALLVSASIFSACGGSDSPDSAGGPSTANGVPDSDGNVPFEVLRRAIMAANTGDFDGAKQWVLPDSAMGTTPAGVDVLPKKWPPFTHNGQVSKVEFIGDEYDEHDASVEYRLHFKDGSTFQEKASFTKDGGRWKITFMTETAMF